MLITFDTFQINILIVVISDEICIILSFQIRDIIILFNIIWNLKSLRIDLLTDDKESNIILFLNHNLHLIKNELQLLPFVHTPVSLHLHLLHNLSRLINVVGWFIKLNHHQTTARILYFQIYLLVAHFFQSFN